MAEENILDVDFQAGRWMRRPEAGLKKEQEQGDPDWFGREVANSLMDIGCNKEEVREILYAIADLSAAELSGKHT